MAIRSMWNPVSEFVSLRDAMDRLVADSFISPRTSTPLHNRSRIARVSANARAPAMHPRCLMATALSGSRCGRVAAAYADHCQALTPVARSGPAIHIDGASGHRRQLRPVFVRWQTVLQVSAYA